VEGAYHNEQNLLSALAKGERQATEQLYKHHYPIVHKWLLKNGCDPDDTADLFQEAMLVLFGKVQNDDFRLTSSVGTYIFSVTKHLWFNKMRNSANRQVSFFDNTDTEEHGLEVAYQDDLNVHLEREGHFNQLNLALRQLGEPCRSLLVAYYHKEKSMAEIARSFGYTNPENAKTQKYKCLARLKKIFSTLQAK